MSSLHTLPSFLQIDEKSVVKKLVENLYQEVTKRGFKRCVIGLSGGMDSTLSMLLTVMAIGRENVTGIKMPYVTSNSNSLLDADLVIEQLGIHSLTIDITPQIDAYFKQWPNASVLRKGNKMARERMSILYDQSLELNALVIGTGNKSEILLGYGTQYGDTACAVNPLGSLYKSQVYQLGHYLKAPPSILHKPPSADLWENQTDEEELGFSYLELDQLLYYMVDHQYSLDQLKDLSFPDHMIVNIQERVMKNEFKRSMPTVIHY